MKKLAFVILAILLVAAGCGGLGEGDLPVIHYFKADPTTVEPGGDVWLSYKASNADAVDIAGKLHSTFVEGQTNEEAGMLVTPKETTTYTMTATKGAQSVTAEVTVTVTVSGEAPQAQPQPPAQESPGGVVVIEYFTADPETITSGEPFRLEWAVSPMSARVDIGPGVRHGQDAMANGSILVFPFETTTYTLTATLDDETATATVTVTVR